MAGAALTHGRRFIAPAGIALLVAAALAANWSGADVAIARLFYDAAAGRFAWRDAPFLTLVLHDAAKGVSIATAIGFVGLALAAPRIPALARWRPALAFTLVAALAAAAIVAMLKAMSGHSCPWDLAAFGGAAAHFPLLAPAPAGAGPGKCLPSGHASTGFMWIAAVYAIGRAPLDRTRQDAARRVLVPAVVAFGAAVSFAQVARGAHFVSHVLLTAALCWTVAWGLDHAAGTRRG